MGRRNELDHMGAYNFTVEIEGVQAGYFKGVDGLQTEIEVIEFQDGDDYFLRKRPGRSKFSDVTLKKGYVVTLFDNAGTEVRRWDLYECWPKSWKVNAFDGKGNDVVTEEITFVVEDMKIAG